MSRVGTLAALIIVAHASPARAQDPTYGDPATQMLIERARERHQLQATRLAGYRAQVFTRLDGGVGAGRFSGRLQVFAYESVSEIHWQAPNDLRIDMLGLRTKSFRIPGLSDRSMTAFLTETFALEAAVYAFLSGHSGNNALCCLNQVLIQWQR